MTFRTPCRRALWALPALLLLAPRLGYAQQRPESAAPAAPPARLLVAVLAMDAVDATKSQASAMTDRLREELLKSRKFTLVDRDLLDKTLQEQALQQAGCTTQECAVQVGKILGVRKIISGRVTNLGPDRWQLSVTMVDVETSETDRAESIRYRGDYFGLLDEAIVQLAQKLANFQQAPLAGVGAVRITTNAPNTRVVSASDRKLLGTASPNSPLVLSNLSGGDLLLRFEAEGYRSSAASVAVAANQIVETAVTLQAEPVAPAAAEAEAPALPKRGFSLRAGVHGVSGTFKPDQGEARSFSAQGGGIGLDYQWVIAGVFTLAPFLDVGGGSVSGGMKSTHSDASAAEVGAELRYWRNRFFVGGDLAVFNTTFSDKTGARKNIDLSGIGLGVVAGYEWERGWYLRAAVGAANPDNKSNTDPKIPTGTAHEVQSSATVGYRWK